jgi:hypothetical protein
MKSAQTQTLIGTATALAQVFDVDKESSRRRRRIRTALCSLFVTMPDRRRFREKASLLLAK